MLFTGGEIERTVSMMLGTKGRRHKPLWSGKGDGVGGVGVVVKEELCEKMGEVKMLCDKVMTAVVIFEEDVLRLMLVYAP